MMGLTATPTPITHTYNEINIGKYSSVRHYELQVVKNGSPQLEPKVQLANNRQFAKSMPLFWFTHRKGGKWMKPFLTGLFRTSKKDVYKGDISHKTNLVIFIIDDLNKTLTVQYYKGYFTHDTSAILNSLSY